MNANIHVIGSRSTPAEAAFNELTKTLGVVNWAIQVQTILSSAGLPAASELAENPSTSIPLGTVAQSFGHTTLGEYIKASKDQLGLARDWTEWVSMAKAFRYKQAFNIFSDNQKEIISQVEDISKVLGRMPFSAVEYHQNKDIIFFNQRKDADRRSKLQADEMQERIRDLMLRVDNEKTHSEELNRRAASTQEKLDAALRNMDEKLTEARLLHDRELERKISAQRIEIETVFKQEMSEMRKQADMRIRESQERLEELTKFHHDNSVSKSVHEVVTEQLERAREENFQLIGSLKETNKKLDLAVSALEMEKILSAEERSKVLTLSSEVERLTSRLNVIIRTPFVGDSADITGEFQHQIDNLTYQLDCVSTDSIQLRKEKEGLKKRLVLYKQRLKESSEINGGLILRLKKAKTTIKIRTNELTTMKKNMWAISAILGFSVITTGLLILAA